MIIGITGGSGSGKTTLLNQIEALGGVVLDCDAIYHRLLQEDKALLSALQAEFPQTFVDNTLNRKLLGQLVFSQPQALKTLNRIAHAFVKREVVQQLSCQPALAAIDAIALHEGGLAQLCDTTVAVIAPRRLRLARLIERDGISLEYAQARLCAQHSDAWFRRHCQHVLENDSDLDAFATKCLAFLESLGIMKEKS